ncbi:YlqD family protein [Candidatus Margulisiibacteriota bacterium]
MVEVSKKSSDKEIELKRVVMVKAIVTDAFKSNLTKELERAIKNIDTQAKQVEFQSKSHIDDLKKKGMMQQLNSFLRQLDEEKGRMGAARADLNNKIEEAKKLKVGSEFVQGPLEGPVNVKVGDNLYKKIGAVELIVKDGIIQEIRGV